jgi:hypothetical protein
MLLAMRNYGSYDHELLVIVESLGQWWYYLKGACEAAEISTNNKPPSTS